MKPPAGVEVGTMRLAVIFWGLSVQIDQKHMESIFLEVPRWSQKFREKEELAGGGGVSGGTREKHDL